MRDAAPTAILKLAVFVTVVFFLVDDAQHSDDPQQRQSVLHRMERSLQELNDLVEELLTFVRLEGPAEDVGRRLDHPMRAGAHCVHAPRGTGGWSTRTEAGGATLPRR